MKLCDDAIRVSVSDDTTYLTMSFLPGVPMYGLPACFYADMGLIDEGKAYFVEMTIPDAFLLAMMLNKALGLEVKV